MRLTQQNHNMTAMYLRGASLGSSSRLAEDLGSEIPVEATTRKMEKLA